MNDEIKSTGDEWREEDQAKFLQLDQTYPQIVKTVSGESSGVNHLPISNTALHSILIDLQATVIKFMEKNEELQAQVNKLGGYTTQLDRAFAKALQDTNQRIDKMVGPARSSGVVSHG